MEWEYAALQNMLGSTPASAAKGSQVASARKTYSLKVPVTELTFADLHLWSILLNFVYFKFVQTPILQPLEEAPDNPAYQVNSNKNKAHN